MPTKKTIEQRNELKEHIEAIIGHSECMESLMKDARTTRLGVKYRALENSGHSSVKRIDEIDFNSIKAEYHLNDGQVYEIEIRRMK